MIKKIVVSISLFFSLISFAQESTASPYSFYGIGEIRYKGTAENRLMGGLSIMADSIHLNIQNPAAQAGLKLTTFTVAGSFRTFNFKTAAKNEKAQRSTLDYLALGFPIGKKFGASFGLIPYSSVGYKISNASSNQQELKRYSGTGGTNKVFAGFGYKVNKNLFVGADVNYNFGQIETLGIFTKNEVQFGTLEQNISDLSGLNINLGATYQKRITRNIDFYSSLTYSPESELKSLNQRTLSSILFTNDFNTQIVESNDTEKATTKIKSPSKLSIGFGLGEQRKWLFGAQYTSIQSSSFVNRFPDASISKYENGATLNIGGYYIPNYNSFSNYFNKVTYRGGFRYEKTGLIVNNESIKEQAFTIGVGLPLGGTFSNLNIGAEFGKRGTAKANLIQENFTNIIISISLNDLWFIKNKYN
jgi:hypothetical protein